MIQQQQEEDQISATNDGRNRGPRRRSRAGRVPRVPNRRPRARRVRRHRGASDLPHRRHAVAAVTGDYGVRHPGR